MAKYKYVYRLDYWAKDSWEEYESDMGYHNTAAEIARESDAQAAEYPDEQIIYLRDLKHDTPRRFKVYAETVREYYAREE